MPTDKTIDLRVLADQIALAVFAAYATEIAGARYCEIDSEIVKYVLSLTAPIVAVMEG